MLYYVMLYTFYDSKPIFPLLTNTTVYGLIARCSLHHTMRKQGNCLEKEIMQGTIPGARRRGRPRTTWMYNIKTWTGLSVEELSIEYLLNNM